MKKNGEYAKKIDSSLLSSKGESPNRKIDSGNLISTEENEYEIRIWIDLDAPNSVQTQEYKARLRIESTQEKEILAGNLSKNWKNYTEDETNFIALYTLDTKEMPETYTYNETTYTLESSVDISEQQNNSVMLGTYSDGTNKIAIMGQDEGVIAPINSSSLFRDLTNLINLNLVNINTSKVENMSSMFYNCNNLQKLDLNAFDTSKVKIMSLMFYKCTNLKALKI